MPFRISGDTVSEDYTKNCTHMDSSLQGCLLHTRNKNYKFTANFVEKCDYNVQDALNLTVQLCEAMRTYMVHFQHQFGGVKKVVECVQLDTRKSTMAAKINI